MNTPCRIEMLGGLRVRQEERLITRFRTQKAGALLAYLAHHSRHTHPREVLIELLWPDLEPSAGRDNLSTILSSLRHQLEPPSVPAGAVFVADRLSVGVNTAAVTTDVEDFEARICCAEQAGSETERAQFLTDAIEVYAGTLLPGYYEEWVEPERRRLADAYLHAVRRLVRNLVKLGEFSRALDYARKAVQSDPLREEAHRDLMRLYVANGQPSAALQQYRELERTLQEALGETPSAATREMARQIQSKVPEAGERQRSTLTPAPISKQATPVETAECIPVGASDSSPTGTVTFLLVEVEETHAASQRNAEALLSPLRPALAASFGQHGGHIFQQAGGSFRVVFAGAVNALLCAVAIQRGLARQAEEKENVPKIRIVLHTGDVNAPQGDYHGRVLTRALRMLMVGHGGQILCSEATAALLHRDLETGIRLADLGVYRLRDASTPQRLFQVEYPEMPERQFLPLNAEAGYASTLPLQFTRFFGREAELSRLQDLLHLPETRLVTLTGPGGAGKTRLAVETARMLVEAFAGAVWFVPLADISDPRRMFGAILEAMRLPPATKAEPLEQIVEALSRQPVLLVLDNFEQLVGEGAALVQTLLARIPTLTCLVTSRQWLGLTGEHEFWVPPLPTPQSAGTPEQLCLYTSVQLFVDRAQTVKPDFQVTSGNAAAVAELCDRLEGMPLAIELAAARAQVVTPAQMLAQLEHRFDFLVSHKRDLAERQRTLRAAIDWSYDLLVPALQRFFVQLSVFRGGWSLEAAEAVCAEPLALDYLAQLRECSLILAEETTPGSTEMRFRMLEMLRAYGEEKRVLEEREALPRRHVDYLLALEDAAYEKLLGPEQPEWLVRLETEHDNFRAALAWCQANDVETGLRLAGGLVTFWDMRGHLSEGRAHLSALLARADAVGPTRARAQALNGAGFFAWKQGDYAEARTLYEDSLALYRELGDQHGVAASLNNLGSIACDQGDYETARSLREEALVINRETGNRAWEAINLQNLGVVSQVLKEYTQAQALHEESLAIRRELGDRWGIAHSLNNLGDVAKNQGDYETADALLKESLAIRRELGDKQGIANSLRYLGDVARHRRDYVSAHTLHQEELEIRQELKDRLGIAGSLQAFADLERAQNRPEQAARLFAAAEALRTSIGVSPLYKEQEEYDRSLMELRTLLGEQAFATAWKSGCTMTPEQAIAFALEASQMHLSSRGS